MYSRDLAELEGKIRWQEQSLGEDHPQVADSLAQLSHFFFVFERYGEAERLLWRAVTITSKWFGQEHLSVAPLLMDLGYLYETQERWAEAEHVYRLAHAVKTVNLGSAHRESMHTARLVVKVVRAQGKPLAERELERLAKAAS